MQPSVLSTYFMPATLVVIMLGLGLSLTLADFKRVLQFPRAIFIGLVCQMLLLPVLCYGLAVAFALPPILAVGLMLLAASPGGAAANLFSHLARGDVALNLTLTAVNSLLSLLTLPFLVNLSLTLFMGEGKVLPLQSDKILQVFAMVLVPVSVGMLIRHHRPVFALRVDRPFRIISAVFLALVVAAAVVKERALIGAAFESVGLAALSFNLGSMALGYGFPRLLRLNQRQSIAIGMEVGIHNGALAITIASSPHLLNSSEMAIPPAIYSLIMFVTAGLFGWLLQRRSPAADA
jgi:BASS family bile acid:Na+ symporter